MKRKGIILDALSLLGKNIGGIIAIVVLFYILLTIVTAGMVYSGIGIAKEAKSTLPAMSILVVLGTAALAGLVQCFADASVIRYVSERKKGNKIGFLKAIGFAFKNWYRLIGAAIIVGIVSAIAGFIVTFISTFISIYVGSEAAIFSIFLGCIIGLISIIITSFLVTGIIMDKRKVFESLKYNFGLLFKTDGKVILQVIGLIIVAFIIIALSALLQLIPGTELFMVYVIALIAQLSLIFVEVGKVIIYDDYK